jgi:hypothetical protein
MRAMGSEDLAPYSLKFITLNLSMLAVLVVFTEKDRKLISGPSPTKKSRVLSLDRTQSRVVASLLTRHNTLRRHLHLMGLTNM